MPPPFMMELSDTDLLFILINTNFIFVIFICLLKCMPLPPPQLLPANY